MLQRQLRSLESFGTWQDAQVPKILSEEEEQTEELAMRALKMLAVRALPRNLVVRALKVKHLAYAQASLPWPSSVLQRPQQQQQQSLH